MWHVSLVFRSHPFHGTIAPPPGWSRAVLARKQVLLLAGDIGLTPGEDLHRHDEKLFAAARAGRLTGARISCGRPQDYGLN